MADVVRFGVLVTTPPQLMPEVIGVPLVDLVLAVETSRGYQPVGRYAGLVLDHFDFGDLSRYLLGRGSAQWPRPGRAWLLGCDAGFGPFVFVRDQYERAVSAAVATLEPKS